MTTFRSLGLLALLLFSATVQAADAPGPKDIDRMAEAMAKALPFGQVFDMLASENPKWPAQDKPEAVSAEQLKCLRGELSVEGYLRDRHLAAERYAQAQPARFVSDLALLESGAAEIFGKLVLAGARSEATGVKPEPERVLAESSAEQIKAFTALMSEPEYSELRKAMGIGDMFDAKASDKENEARGEDTGANLASKLLLQAADTCGISDSAFK